MNISPFAVNCIFMTCPSMIAPDVCLKKLIESCVVCSLAGYELWNLWKTTIPQFKCHSKLKMD